MAVKVNNESRLKLISGYRVSGGIGQYFRKHSAVNLGLSQFGMPYSSILTLVDGGILHRGEFETGILDSKSPLQLQIQQQHLKLTPKSATCCSATTALPQWAMNWHSWCVQGKTKPISMR